MSEKRGQLIIIGGAEDKTGDCAILKHAAQKIKHDDILTILTTATEQPAETGMEYKKIFKQLGVKKVNLLDISTRDDANNEKVIEKLKSSRCVFFTGGDQLRLTSILGGTVTDRVIKELYEKGNIIMGTSAGASVMSSTMVVKGDDNEPAKKCTLKMAPGLDLIEDTIIDQHFGQRGRFGRLLCGVAENPHVLGIGIDEDTAIEVGSDMIFEVLGTNTVTIIDGRTIKASNVSELEPDEMLAIVGVTVHTLPKGYGFDMRTRQVKRLKSGEAERS